MILEVKDQDTLMAIEALSEIGISVKVRDDREVTWVGDSLYRPYLRSQRSLMNLVMN